MLFSAETLDQLRGFLYGRVDFSDFCAWVISAIDDSDLPDAERTALAELRLLLLEYDESLRSIEDARTWITDLLAKAPSPAT